MSHRELLRAAAKAAGIELVELDECQDVLPDGTAWNPLDNDGDALRLAVRLRIAVEPWIHGDSACARASAEDVMVDEPHYGDDPERATRRAVVRAAAALSGDTGIGEAAK